MTPGKSWLQSFQVTHLYSLSFRRKGHNRRKSSTRSLHQKLVISKNNVKKATKVDMDDRAKMLQYFSKANDDTKTISIHDMFFQSWQVPMLGPRTPTVVTVQAMMNIHSVTKRVATNRKL